MPTKSLEGQTGYSVGRKCNSHLQRCRSGPPPLQSTSHLVHGAAALRLPFRLKPLSNSFSIFFSLPVHPSFRGTKGPHILTEFQLDFEPEFATESLDAGQTKFDSQCLLFAVQFVGEDDFCIEAMSGEDSSGWKPRRWAGFLRRVFVITDTKSDDGNCPAQC